MSEDEQRTRQLVLAVADYLSRNGYRTATGVSMRGRSGANYVLDVMGEKTDDVTTFRLFVECKSTGAPVEKEVIAGVHLAMTDLGINKSIVLSTKGWKQATQTGARRLGIELWGPADIEGRLGRAATGDESAVSVKPVTAEGFPINLAREEAEQLVRRAGRGVLGIGGEEVAWFREFWLPFYRMKVRHTREEQQRFRKPTLKTREFWNVYDGLSGALYDQWEQEPSATPMRTEVLVRPRIPGLQVVNDIEETARKFNESTNPDTTLRLEERLIVLGIDLPVSFFDLSTPVELYIPFYLALLRSRDGQQRIVAVDASSREVSEDMSRIAMMNVDHIAGSVKR